ncbi:MAG: hypothetical protein DRQ88_04360 [Epsilonproteobacteria bacterium]|nr:MAG: hypothetical protein DRQ89_10080 [Campylobacterota bacterium]RLA66991.1 MAG: hypothetical protein DRQ88_04360 [Campylobacterota bacterium]
MKNKNIKDLLNTFNGFTLVEIMLAVSMLSLVALGVMKISQDAGKIRKVSTEKLETENLISIIHRHFRDPETCRSTLFGKDPTGEGEQINSIIKKAGIMDIKVYEGGTPDIGGDELSQYNGASIVNTYVRADCPNVVGAASKPCTYGSGPGRILLKELRVLAYEMTHADSSKTASPYKNQSKMAFIEITMVKGIAIGKADTKKIRDVTLGAVEYKRRVAVGLLLDSNNKIADCITELTSFQSGACDQLNGTIDFDNRCKNLTILAIDPEPTGTPPPNKEGITTEADTNVKYSLKVANTLDVGNSGAQGTGNFNIDGEGTVKNDLNITEGNLIFGTNVTLDAINPGEATLYQNAGENEAKLKLGTTLSIHGKNAQLGIQTITDPAFTLDLIGDARFTGKLTEEKDLQIQQIANIGGTVQATFKIVGNGLEISGVDVEIQNNHNNGNKSSEDNLIATRQYIYDLFSDRLGDQPTFDQLIDALLNFDGSNQLEQLNHAICLGMSNAVWDGKECKIPSEDALCLDKEFLIGFDASGKKICAAYNLDTWGVPTNSVLIGISSSGVGVFQPLDIFLRPHINLLNKQKERCFSKYPASSGYTGTTFNMASRRCTSFKTTSFQYKMHGSCGVAWKHDTEAECKCWQLGGGWTYAGQDGCKFNWVTDGYQCKCVKSNGTTYKCTVNLAGTVCY